MELTASELGTAEALVREGRPIPVMLARAMIAEIVRLRGSVQAEPAKTIRWEQPDREGGDFVR